MNSAANNYSNLGTTNYSTRPAQYSNYSSSYQSINNSRFSFSEISVVTWIIIILVLAIFGINVFLYLASGTQWFSDTFGPYIKYFSALFGTTIAETSKQIVNTSATGTKAGVDFVSGTFDSGVNKLQQLGGKLENLGTGDAAGAGTPTNKIQGATKEMNSTSMNSNTLQNSISPHDIDNNRLNSILNSAKPESPIQEIHSYNADESSSSIQSSKSSSKSGWCFIGEDRGFRSCIQVNENDTCMSGNIFPTKDICINPTLRA